ncbi:hypothetical protein [Peredibacter starrii]|uniref:Uncharacterized protein n=1 Tax=Peredibacter starrii TaxID=28202 RepID=A0AAX4HJW5_9BACT|nr:hypothetical protein [Peredibacter starrii]WPU63546.1 hypothetical protein SOO65_12690 [Peredibacter starrii]
MRKLLSYLFIFVISFGIALPKGVCAPDVVGFGEFASIETFFDLDSDTSDDDKPDNKGHCKKADSAEPYFIPTRFQFNVKTNPISFLERLPSFIASYYQIFHVPPSL